MEDSALKAKSSHLFLRFVDLTQVVSQPGFSLDILALITPQYEYGRLEKHSPGANC
jgi:hypothetical protein